MGAIFSKPKPKVIAKKDGSLMILEKDRAVLSLKVARDKLRRYQIKLGKDSSKLETQAKELIALKLKDRALLVLKLKKFKQKELDGIDSKLLSVQSQINDIEWASINVSILNAIESGTKELNRIHEERTLEDVETLMNDTNEAIEVENRINRVLAGQLSVLEDAELESELEAILSSINKKTDNILPDTTSVVTSSAENVPEALQTTSVEAVVEKNVITAFPQVPTAPIIPLPPKHEVILSRTAVPS